MKEDKVLLQNGESKDVKIFCLTYPDRNKILKTYLDLKKYFKMQGDENANIIECIKDDLILDFIEEVLKKGIPALNLGEIESSEGDRLFSEHVNYILSGEVKN